MLQKYYQYRTRGQVSQPSRMSHLPFIPTTLAENGVASWGRNIKAAVNLAGVSSYLPNILKIHVFYYSIFASFKPLSWGEGGGCLFFSPFFILTIHNQNFGSLNSAFPRAVQSSRRKAQLLGYLYFLSQGLKFPFFFFTSNPTDIYSYYLSSLVIFLFLHIQILLTAPLSHFIMSKQMIPFPLQKCS